MAKTKISEFDVNPDNNTDINNINIAEGCAPSGINNAIRQLMSDLKDLQAGTSGDTIPIAAGGTGSTTAAGARTALGLVIGTNVQAYDADLTAWSSVATSAKQDTLVSGTNIKTINGTSLLGSGDITSGDVTTSGTQTLTNKTISADDNTISGIAASSFVLSNGSGNIDGSASQKAIPSGVVVGTTDTQTLTNKTLTDPVITGTILEDIFTITDGVAFEIDPSNGSIQLITLGANRTPKATNFVNGESVTLMVDDGTARTLTWTDSTFGGSGVVWKTNAGVAPTLNTTGFTVIVLWKVGGQVYGSRVGDA
jgi:hypothetical protein